VATNATQPVGTGPYRLESWNKGASLVLSRWEQGRDAKRAPMRRVTIRFISDAAAQVAALLAGDVDCFPRVSAAKSLEQFKRDPRFQVLIGGSRAKTILAINNKRKPLDDVRVRRAIAMAIDRKQVIEGAADGFGTPIGSFYVPGAPGYVDLTSVNAYNPERARALLKEAGVATPLDLTLKLPPTPYARQGGEVIAAMLAKVGINARQENVEWAQWMSGVYGQKAYDLTHHFARGAAGLRQLRAAGLLLELRVGEVQRTVGTRQHHRRAARRASSTGRGPAVGGRRCRGRVPLPAHLDHGGPCAAQGLVVEHAHLRQRPGGVALGVRSTGACRAVAHRPHPNPICRGLGPGIGCQAGSRACGSSSCTARVAWSTAEWA
jgi:hypothetical protein